MLHSVKTVPYTCTREHTLNDQLPILYSFQFEDNFIELSRKEKEKKTTTKKKAVKMNPFNAKTEQRTFFSSSMATHCLKVVIMKMPTAHSLQ